MPVRIIVDSAADMLPTVKARLQVVPLTIRFGSQEYVDGVTIDHRTFYEKLIESDVIPTTSQATPAAFASVFDTVKEAGDSAVVITVASRLSGTHQSAVMAAGEYDHIYVVDSGTAAIGAGILAELALKLADSGLCAEKIAKRLEQEKRRIHVVALLDTLAYLKKGGRISGATAFAGGLLNIKPVVSIMDGEIRMLGRARGSKQGNNLLAQEIQRAGGVDFTAPVLLGYTGISSALLDKYVEDSRYLWAEDAAQLPGTPIGSVIGTHAGPGAIAVAFFSKG